MYQAGGTWSVSSLRADGYPEYLSVSPGQGPIDGRGGIAYVEITSVVSKSPLSPVATDFLHYMQTPEAAYRICVAGGSLNPVATIDDVADRLTDVQRMAIQYGDEWAPFDLANHMEICAEFAVNPDYDAMVAVWSEALKSRV
jgi:spermidine/putrescine transport system substrate-binding protein